ncbi:hypothetical protein [Amycolatopsis jejuensis]|uniref:hypothetical protein n=1 Tax=Amycolatopsis jejuensis TaxID=330084 RepID=UPI0005256772|nr:hypothetical protein [Amycolatopsis jejuensis]
MPVLPGEGRFHRFLHGLAYRTLSIRRQAFLYRFLPDRSARLRTRFPVDGRAVPFDRVPPPDLLTVPGIRRDREVEEQTARDDPLRLLFDTWPEVREHIHRSMYRNFFRVGPMMHRLRRTQRLEFERATPVPTEAPDADPSGPAAANGTASLSGNPADAIAPPSTAATGSVIPGTNPATPAAIPGTNPAATNDVAQADATGANPVNPAATNDVAQADATGANAANPADAPDTDPTAATGATLATSVAAAPVPVDVTGVAQADATGANPANPADAPHIDPTAATGATLATPVAAAPVPVDVTGVAQANPVGATLAAEAAANPTVTNGAAQADTTGVTPAAVADANPAAATGAAPTAAADATPAAMADTDPTAAADATPVAETDTDPDATSTTQAAAITPTATPATPTPHPDSVLTADVFRHAHTLGIPIIGVAEYDPKYHFAGHTTPPLGDRVVVCFVEQDYAATQSIPSLHANNASFAASANAVRAAGKLAKYLRELGFRARVNDEYEQGIVINYGVQAGLGQLGMNGQLLTPQFGSRCHPATITTDAPLEFGKPVDYGITRICEECRICVRRCPPGAIPARRRMYRGVEKAKIDAKRCGPTVAVAEGCAVCTKVCPVQKFGLAAVYDEWERSGTILGKGTDQLEGYWFDGVYYDAARRPKLEPTWLELQPKTYVAPPADR